MTQSRVRRALALCIACLSASATGARPAFAAAPPDLVNARVPLGASPTTRDAYYVIEAAPGSSSHKTIILRNPNSHTVQADIQPVSAFTSRTGASYGTPGSKPTDTATWISIATSRVALAPDEVRKINFSVDVPPGTPAGQYLAGLSASVPLPPQAAPPQSSGSTANFAVTLQPQRVIAVQVNVPGPRQARFEVRGVRPKIVGDRVRLEFDIANIGNAFAKGTGVATVTDTQTRREFKIETFIPHTAIKYTVDWTGEVVAGSHDVSMRLQDRNGHIVNWSGRVDLVGKLGDDLRHALALVKNPQHGGSTSSLPMVPIAAVATLVLVGAALFLHRKRGSKTAVRIPIQVDHDLGGRTASSIATAATPREAVGTGASRRN